MVDILYQDARYVAVNKQGGLLVHPTKLAPDGLAVLPMLRKQLGRYVYPVHRLDRGTSGVLLFALDPDAARRMSDLIQSREVDKQYLAVTRGYLEGEGVIDYAYDDGEHTGPVDAQTEYRCEATVELPYPVGRYESARYSLVRARIVTGRRHQIRRHFAHLRHPVVGDTTHGDGDHNRFWREKFRLPRMLLFATGMRFAQPFTGERVTIEAPVSGKVQHVFNRFGWPACPGYREDLDITHTGSSTGPL